jgi:hypothetical protein
MIEKEFAPYEEALVLKELGFNEPCFGYWKSKNWLIQEKTRTDGYTHADQECSAPLYQQAFRWFREKYGLNHEIPYAGKVGKHHAFVKNYIYGNNGNSPSVFTYEEAELACLKKLIELANEEPTNSKGIS